MQKVIIDSSVWVSYIAKDSNHLKAKAILSRLLRKKDGRKILVPRIIYLEVINSLRRLKKSLQVIESFRSHLKLKKIILVKTNEKIYIKADKLSEKVRLKTLDLLILTTVLELKIDKFFSFDKKLRKAYHLIKFL